MKKIHVIIAICLVAVCVVGWLTVASQGVKKNNLYSDYIKEADALMERGLYQRAISSYNLALNEKSEEEVYLKINEAYVLRYKEAPEETLDDYLDFLDLAVSTYPGNSTLIDSFVEMYYIESRYEEIYNCLIAAVKNGNNSPKIMSELRKVRYTFDLRRGVFSGIKQSVGNCYAVKNDDGWNAYAIDNGYLLTSDYDYVSCANEDGVVVVTGEDSRIVDTGGMVYGIFKGKVTDASLFSDDLIAACVDGIYSYYNDLADKQFGEYEMAGSFQDGKAAVKKNGKWMLIDTSGKVISDKFDEIVLDNVGNYLVGGTMLAKVGGTYGLYDKKLKLKFKLDCSDVDVLTEDGILAVCKDDKWGFVDKEGKILIKPKYEDAKSFSNGLAAVKKNGAWGFIDLDDNVVIDFQFFDVGYMSEKGICPVRTDFLTVPSDSSDEIEWEIVESWRFLELELGIKED